MDSSIFSLLLQLMFSGLRHGRWSDPVEAEDVEAEVGRSLCRNGTTVPWTLQVGAVAVL